MLPSRGLSLIAPAALLLALAYSQVNWRHDRTIAVTLASELSALEAQRTFPTDGDDIADSPLRVIRASDTVPLATLVRGRTAVIYIYRADCSACVWLASQLDSILPTWRDSLVMVSTHRRDRPAPALMFDTASTTAVTGVPAMLVVDADGIVRHSARGGLPQVAHLLQFAQLPSLVSRIQGYSDGSVTKSSDAANPSSIHAK